MNMDKKSKIIKFLKIMAAYFGLYIFHYIILPSRIIYEVYLLLNLIGLEINITVIALISLLLFPIVDRLFLKSNAIFAFLGMVLYSLCVCIYDSRARYNLGVRGFLITSFSRETLWQHLIILTIFYMIWYMIIVIIIHIIKGIIDYIKNKKDKEGL